jgi:hypothetical protein
VSDVVETIGMFDLIWLFVLYSCLCGDEYLCVVFSFVSTQVSPQFRCMSNIFFFAFLRPGIQITFIYKFTYSATAARDVYW